MAESPHEFLQPDGLMPARGFSHVAVPAAGRTVYVAGQTAHDAEGVIVGETHAEQWAQALKNLVTALDAAGAEPGQIVSMQIYVTDIHAYRRSLTEIGEAWNESLGRHYPAISLFGIDALVAPEAEVEIVATAVVPE
ncbi:MAG: RidA family protein [Nitriliruptorales bacterium]|nr:RidA family protein [Nitriliruptorales bacterium]